MSSVIEKVFLECVRAIETSQLITRVSTTDKEYSFQNWFSDRLTALGLNFDEPSRNAYPDFRLVDFPVGFEIKGLGFPDVRQITTATARFLPVAIMAAKFITCSGVIPHNRRTNPTRFTIW
jgi:hypothetical protein